MASKQCGSVSGDFASRAGLSSICRSLPSGPQQKRRLSDSATYSSGTILTFRPCFTIAFFAAIGPATKKAIVKHGLNVKMVPEEYVAESVVKGLRDKVNGKRLVLIRAKVARDVIPEELQAAGAMVDVIEAYETVVPEKSRARLRALMKNAARRPHVVTFTSSSTAKNFAELFSNSKGSLPAALLKHVQFASIGPVTSATLRELHMPVAIEAREFTTGGLIRAIVLARYAETSM